MNRALTPLSKGWPLCNRWYMVARINTIAFQGVDVQNIDVQVQISNGLPCFTIVEYIKLLHNAFIKRIFKL